MTCCQSCVLCWFQVTILCYDYLWFKVLLVLNLCSLSVKTLTSMCSGKIKRRLGVKYFVRLGTRIHTCMYRLIKDLFVSLLYYCVLFRTGSCTFTITWSGPAKRFHLFVKHKFSESSNNLQSSTKDWLNKFCWCCIWLM